MRSLSPAPVLSTSESLRVCAISLRPVATTEAFTEPGARAEHLGVIGWNTPQRFALCAINKHRGNIPSWIRSFGSSNRRRWFSCTASLDALHLSALASFLVGSRASPLLGVTCGLPPSWVGLFPFCPIQGCILGTVCVHDCIPSYAPHPFVASCAGLAFRRSTRVCFSPIRGLGGGG